MADLCGAQFETWVVSKSLVYALGGWGVAGFWRC